MSTEDALRKLEEMKKQKDEAYTTIKGMIKGIRLGKLSPVEESFLRVLEVMFTGFKNVWDDIFIGFELQLATTQKISNLEAKIGELKTNIQQIREALDEEFHLFRDR